MRNFFIFLGRNPKPLLMAVGVVLAQVLKLIGLSGCDRATLDAIMDGLSVIFGFIGLFLAGKAEWPKDEPKP
jgi:ABC-type uncharacterized transport system YnjBCD ATPase subunit